MQQPSRSGGGAGGGGVVLMYSVRRRIDICLVVVLLGVIYGMYAHIVPSEEVRPLNYAERVYLLALVTSGGVLLAGYVYKWAGAAVAANSLAFYTLFLLAVAPRNTLLTAPDGSSAIVIPFYNLWVSGLFVVYALVCIWQGRGPGDFFLKSGDPVVAYHRAMDAASDFLDANHYYGASNHHPYAHLGAAPVPTAYLPAAPSRRHPHRHEEGQGARYRPVTGSDSEGGELDA